MYVMVPANAAVGQATLIVKIAGEAKTMPSEKRLAWLRLAWLKSCLHHKTPKCDCKRSVLTLADAPAMIGLGLNAA